MTSSPAATAVFSPTICAICGPSAPETELYPANFSPEDLSPGIFSARRLPDRTHFRIVTCDRCGLVRSNPVADSETLTELYAESTFDYGQEIANLRRTYGRYLARLEALGGRKESLLEVGCGNGFFLEEALDQGYRDPRGVEPSSAAIAAAGPGIGERIVCDIMRPGLFAPESFDAVCLFQVFDHLPDPGGLLDECHKVLRPGGLVLCLNHNVEAPSARLLKERSPIIDIEHTYLYSPRTLATLFRQHGFEKLEAGGVTNTYSLGYLGHLVPAPARVKGPLIRGLRSRPLAGIRVSVPLGNLYMVARKAPA
jgi:SAM-dependent methyltransferase